MSPCHLACPRQEGPPTDDRQPRAARTRHARDRREVTVAQHRLTDADRDRVVSLARDGWPRNAIAREIGCGPNTVSRWCRRAGVEFDRSGTVQATAARQADNRSRRAGIASGLLDDLHGARGALDPGGDAREFAFRAKALRDLASSYADLAKLDTDTDADAAEQRSMLAGLQQQIQVAVHTGPEGEGATDGP